MAQYIDKDALVAKIERRINEMNLDPFEDWHYRLQSEHDIEIMKNIISLIDSLVGKEVDLEKEISSYLYSNLGRPRMSLEFDWTQYDIQFKADKLINFAKHFFELGLQAQKGE